MLRNIFIMLLLLSLNHAALAAEWSTSANLRERYQSFNNFDFNSSAVDTKNWEFDSRLYIKTKADFNNGLTLFLQPQAIAIQNNSPASGTQNFSQVDLLQAYLQYNITDFLIRLGRQQLVYGDQRLLGHLGWKDVARTFDGVKMMYANDALSIDVFAVHPADIGKMTPSTANPQAESLVTWEDRSLLGAYATYKLAKKSGIDAYLINWRHNQKAAVGKGRNINTFGTRFFVNSNGFDGTAEAVFQTGTWSNNVSQKASAYAIKAGYTFDGWKTRLGIEYDYSPGDASPTTGTHKDFVFPFHTNHAQYGEMDFFSWANMRDLRFSLKTTPMKGLTLMGNAHLFSLDKSTGNWLNVVGVGNVFAGSPLYSKTKAGDEFDIKLVYKPSAFKGLKLVALYGIFNPGEAVRERNAGKADQASFGYMFSQYAF